MCLPFLWYSFKSVFAFYKYLYSLIYSFFLLIQLTFAIFTTLLLKWIFHCSLSIYLSMMSVSLLHKGLPVCQWFLKTYSAMQLLEASMKGLGLRVAVVRKFFTLCTFLFCVKISLL